ncbi:undecaprenyl-phosphate alpha-N-acetylglucosaminyl 1-phosphate transferase [Bacteroidia bacterium]|nr:undecaprenyl-phosphate alpha-N-acetylglucosaminyl 1-phosphate transferase [Bacteroidia bacterium]GHV07453.1 undecaprenyl-phosphate alpha-N-acetylglucosaminyl 1-phosphate transferase [Bacteroidia bacterium]
MIYLIYLTVLLFSAGLTSVVIPFTLRISEKKRLFDVPDDRKVHTTPTSRLGGIAFVPVIIAAFNLGIGLCFHFALHIDMQPFEQFTCLFVGLSVLYFLGFCDDLIGVRYSWKFCIQIIAACLFPISGLWINSLGGLFGIYAIPMWIGIPLTLFVVVYITNAINLIDGIDGLASGLSCITLVVMGLLALFHHQVFFILVIAAAIGVLLPFLYHNIFGSVNHQGKLFMGDTGSLTLGYIISFFVICFSHSTPEFDAPEHGSQWIVFSSLIIPLFDVIWVVLSRFRDRRPLFMPDKNHIHHKFLSAGLSVTQTLISLLLISFLFVALHYFLNHYIQIIFVLLLDIVLWIGMLFILNYFIQKQKIKTGKIERRVYN